MRISTKERGTTRKLTHKSLERAVSEYEMGNVYAKQTALTVERGRVSNAKQARENLRNVGVSGAEIKRKGDLDGGEGE